MSVRAWRLLRGRIRVGEWLRYGGVFLIWWYFVGRFVYSFIRAVRHFLGV